MSRVLETAFEEVKKTKITFIDNGHFEIQEAFIFWTNFAGKENQFKNATRNFNVAIPEEAVQILIDLGYRVRQEKCGEGVDANGNPVPLMVYFINVKINMESAYPPVIKLFTEYKGKKDGRLLNIDTVSELDRIDYRRCDCTVHSYTSQRFPGKCTGYLERLYVIQETKSVFGGAYDDWDTPLDDTDILPVMEEESKY